MPFAIAKNLPFHSFQVYRIQHGEGSPARAAEQAEKEGGSHMACAV